MRHSFFESSRPLVFAHRGGSALAPENTLAAFDAGVAAGADGIELDVRLSRDGIVVVHHDRLLDRTTNLAGPVAQRTADELGRADAAYRFGTDERRPFAGQGIGVPRLDEVLARYRDARIIIELKEDTVELAQRVVDVVRTRDAVDRVCVGSFGLAAMHAVRRFEPAVATSAARDEVRWAVYRSWCRLPPARVAYCGYQVPERSGLARIVSHRFVERAHRAGLAVQVWTVDSEEHAARLLAWGVDALITDRPDRLAAMTRRASR